MPGLLRPGATLQTPKRLPIGRSLRIDWSHPLTNGLIGCFVPGITGGVNLAGQCAPLAIKTATDTRKATQDGPSWTTTADSAGLFGASCPAAFKTWTQFSIYWRGFFTSYSTNNTKVFGIEFDNIGSTPFAVASLGYGGSTGTNFVAEWNTNGTYTHDVGVALSAGLQGLCGTFKVGGNVVLYRNGIVIDTTAFGATAPTNAASSLINFQTSNGNAGNFSGSGNVGYMWKRELSAGEVTLLDSDPYAFLIADEYEMSALFVDTLFDVSDNPTEPFVLRPPLLSPAQPFAIRAGDTPVSPEAPFPSLVLKQPNLSPAQPFAIRIDNPTPSQDLAFWMEPQGIQRQTPPVDTNQPDWYNEDLLEPNVWWWLQPRDVQYRPPPTDTNQPDWLNETQNEPAIWWWDQPPDLLRHTAHLDTNLPVVSYRDRDTPTDFDFWFEPIDLERHPQQVDPNQSRVSYQDQATPTSWSWLQQIALQWHPPQLDTNESRLVSQQFAEPGVWWWTSPIDLQRHPTHLETNQSRIVNPVGWTPTSYFLLPQISVQRRTPEAFANQSFVFFPAPSGATPLEFGFWAQPLDLHRHPTHLDTNQQRLVYPVGWTPTSFGFWAEPIDLQRHAAHLDTNQSFVFLPPIPGSTPLILGFWAQPPDLFRHATFLDTNFPRVSYQDRATPSGFGFWIEPPDLLRHPSTLDTNESRLVSQQFAEPGVWWWTQPQMQPPRAPDLWASQPYVGQGWQLTANGLFVPVPAFMRPSAPNLAVAAFAPGFLAAETPKSLAFFAQPHLFKHPLELITWQYRVGAIIIPPNATPADTSYFGQPQDLLRRPAAYVVQPWTRIPGFKIPFFGSAFVANRLRLSQPSTKARHNIAVKGLSSLSSANTILRGFRRMSRAPDLSPPIVAGVEQEYVTFDFAQGLNTGINISAIIAVNVYSLTGNDATPMARLLNTPAIIASPSSSVASQAVYGLFGNMIAGLYLLQAIIQTSDGQVLSTEARWPCVPATP